MIANDAELAALQARVQVIQAVLAHTRRTLEPEDFEHQAKGWLLEWDGLETEIRAYLATPAPDLGRQFAAAS